MEDCGSYSSQIGTGIRCGWIDVSYVWRWRSNFVRGRCSGLDDEPHSGRLLGSLLLANIKPVCQLLDEDPCYTLAKLVLLMPQAGIARTTIHTIIHNVLEYHKLCCRLIPKVLTENHKMLRMGATVTFLTCYREVGRPFLDTIVTGMRRGWCFTPQSKNVTVCIG